MKSKKSDKSLRQRQSRTKISPKQPEKIEAWARDLTLRAIADRNVSFDELSDFAGDMLTSAANSMKQALPASQKSALWQVVNGIEEAWAATATASVGAPRHARRYGIPLASRDLEQLGSRLTALEHEFVNTIEQIAQQLGGDLGRELRSIGERASLLRLLISPYRIPVILRNINRVSGQSNPHRMSVAPV